MKKQAFFLRTLPALAALTWCSPSLAGTGGGTSLSGVEAQAEFEIAQRRGLVGNFAPQAMERGTDALAVRDYEKAFSEYRAALDAIPDAPETRELHKIALDGFTKAAMGLAEQRIAEGRWEDAEATVSKLLEYNPTYQPARRLLSRLQSPDYFNKTVTPGFVSRVEQVKKLLVDAQGFCDSGRFDDAFRRYEDVLRLDRYYIAARRGLVQVVLAR
ncbi:MAG: type II and III secretion system protein, partial [Chthoniobacterales bacterium]